MKTNQRSLSTDSSSDLVQLDAPHYYEVVIPNHPNGVPKMHCGTMRDVEMLLEKYPDATMTKIYLPHPPQTVDVSSVSMGKEQALQAQQILPESQQQPLNL